MKVITEETWVQIAERYNRKYRKIIVLAEQQNYRCCYCGINMVISGKYKNVNRPDAATIEHVIPRTEHGERGYHNEVAACRLCNNIRSADNAMEFYEWRLKNPTNNLHILQKAMNQHRRAKLKAVQRAKREAIHKARLTKAYATPYILRVFAVANRLTSDLLHHLMLQILARSSDRGVVDSDARKYRRNAVNADDIVPQYDPSPNYRHRSGHPGCRSRGRHKKSNPASVAHTSTTDSQQQQEQDRL